MGVLTWEISSPMACPGSSRKSPSPTSEAPSKRQNWVPKSLRIPPAPHTLVLCSYWRHILYCQLLGTHRLSGTVLRANEGYLINPLNFPILVLQSDPQRRRADTLPCSRLCSKPIKYTNSSNSCNNPLSCELLLSPFNRQGSQSLGRFSNLARVTQQALRQKKDLRLKLRASEECGLQTIRMLSISV